MVDRKLVASGIWDALEDADRHYRHTRPGLFRKVDRLKRRANSDEGGDIVVRPLGRIVQHDEASKSFQAARATQLVSVLHHRRSKPFDQGELGSCTGNAMAGLLDTAPFTHSRLSERTAIKLYELATTLDGEPGQYPPDDTGSSGLAVAKAAKQLGYITSYSHAFGLQHALQALVLAPVITGIPWYDSFDEPTAYGLISISPGAQVRGGHEVEVVGIDVDMQRVRICNSWGTSWGDHGYCDLDWDDWATCLANQGDVTTIAVP